MMTTKNILKANAKVAFTATVLLFGGLSAAAVEIRGTVFDLTNNENLSGAVVKVKGSGSGALSKGDGSFAFSTDEALPVKLEVSYLGYNSQEVVVKNDAEPVKINLEEKTRTTEEVVVVGYGTQRRKELTGAVASVGADALRQSGASLDALLGGTVSGVNVTQTSGQPGAGSEIRIRGGNSVCASNEPLYVIDGFIYYNEKGGTSAGVSGIASSLNPLASINPSDIERVEILKDVSAKAIYGSRGANGVVLITTKKGTRGSNTLNYQYTVGVDKSAKKLKLLNAEQWRNYAALTNNTDLNKPDWIAFDHAQTAAHGQNTDTDWQDAVLQTGLTQTHELSFNGGDDKTRYSISGNYTDQKGIILNSGFKRFSGRINVDRIMYKYFTVGANVSADRSTQTALTTLESGDFKGTSSPFKSGITNSLVYALFMPSVLPIYGTNGDYNHYNPFEQNGDINYYGTSANPVRDLKESIGQTVSTTLLGNLFAKYDIPYVKGLSVKVTGGLNTNYITQNFFAPPKTVLGINADIQGRGSVGNRRTDVVQTDYLLTYTKKIGSAHFLDILSGYTYQQTKRNIIVTKADHLSDFKFFSMGTPLRPYTYEEQANLHSLLGRVNYTLLGRYNLTASFRADESSRFAEGHRWGYFPAVGVSWNVSDERFMQPLKPALSSLKLRLTYGKAGNAEIGLMEYAVISQVQGGEEPVLTTVNAGNNKLTWETTTEYNAGLDFGFWKDRITLVADVYYKRTDDLLAKKLEWPSGLEQVYNFGSLSNKGFELAVNANIIERKNFSWSVAANFARNVNTILKLIANDYTEGDSRELILREGESFGSFYGFIYDGVAQADEDLSKVPAKSGQVLQPGDVKLRDVNGDGIITDDDLTVIGSIQPDFIYGFSTTLAFYGFDLYIAWQGSQGNEVYNKLRRHLSENNTGYNRSADILDAWTPENPSKDVPRLDAVIDKNSLYSRYVEDGSFLKLRNVTLGYTLPVKIDKFPVKFRFFVSGQNLLTITKYKGYDPEVAGGIDTGAYPTARSFLAGIGVTF